MVFESLLRCKEYLFLIPVLQCLRLVCPCVALVRETQICIRIDIMFLVGPFMFENFLAYAHMYVCVCVICMVCVYGVSVCILERRVAVRIDKYIEN